MVFVVWFVCLFVVVVVLIGFEVYFGLGLGQGRSFLWYFWNGEEDMSMRSLFLFGILFDFCILCITFFH